MIQIPLTGGAENSHQEQSIQLGDNFVQLRINYITRFDGWAMDVLVGGVIKIAGAMLEPNAVISASYRAGLGQFLFLGDQPTLDNLGSANQLVWIDG